MDVKTLFEQWWDKAKDLFDRDEFVYYVFKWCTKVDSRPAPGDPSDITMKLVLHWLKQEEIWPSYGLSVLNKFLNYQKVKLLLSMKEDLPAIRTDASFMEEVAGLMEARSEDYSRASAESSFFRWGNSIQCFACGCALQRKGGSEKWEVGHVLANKHGGRPTIFNLAALCKECNNTTLKTAHVFDRRMISDAKELSTNHHLYYHYRDHVEKRMRIKGVRLIMEKIQKYRERIRAPAS